MVVSPACPACGYDFSGAVAGWASACPLETRCPECGRAWPSGLVFEGEAGPRWSFEHARRRLGRRWLATTVMTLRPRRLWRELRPEHVIRARRLTLLAASWLALLHATTLAIVGGSGLWMQLSPIYGWWPAMDRPFWGRVLWRVLWPYGGWVEIPISANSSFGNPVLEFVEMGAGPHLAMALLMLLWARPLCQGEVARRHLLRALVLCLPMAVATVVASVLVFAATALNQLFGLPDALAAATMASLLTGIGGALIWWWRCFAVEYLGCRRWTWTLVPLGILALILTWIAAFAIGSLIHH